MSKIETLSRLRAVIGQPHAQINRKIHRRLNARGQQFVARSPMVLLSTADASGQPTVSPKGDVPGFVRVADDSTLLIPERAGNKLVFSLQNILANPRVGLIFLVPGTCETLRVSGEAEIRDDAGLRESFTVRGKPALLVTCVRVAECYFHCAKAFLRSELWKPETWPERVIISFGEEIAEEGGLERAAIAEFDAGVHSRYKTDL
jgi:PPOX class probable FMN-dependent enzyme